MERWSYLPKITWVASGIESVYQPRSPKLLSLSPLYDPAGFPFKLDYLKSCLSHLCHSQSVTKFYIICFRNCSPIYSAFCTLMVYLLWSKPSIILICVILIVSYGTPNIKPNIKLSYLPVQCCFVLFLLSQYSQNLHFFKICPHPNYLFKFISSNTTS